jgi:phosphoribosylformylglycinamidine synthase
MLLAVPAENIEQVIEAFAYEEVESVVVGELTRGDSVLVFSNGEKVAELDLEFLFHPPTQVLTARFTDTARRKSRKSTTALPTTKKSLFKVLSSYNVGTKESVIRTYDHEVKGNTVVKPLQLDGNGPNDACVLKPVDASNKGVVISNGVNPSFGRLDAYAMAASCIDEAVRNNIAAGGRRICLLDNFIWPSPERPEMLGALVRAAEACYEVAKELRTPFISGKDSLYNESSAGPITPTIVITALGIIPDISMAVASAFKTPGNSVYILGNTYDELGGSEYYKTTGNDPRGHVPIVRASDARENFDIITKSIDEELVAACHDISQGGLATAIAEMTFANNLGADVNLSYVPTSRSETLSPNEIAFSESNSRFIIEVRKSKEKRFEKIGEKTGRVARVGRVSHKPELRITYGRSEILVREDVARLRRAWRFPLGA